VPAANGYNVVVILIFAVIAVAAIIMALTHLIGPKRFGAVKHSIYESGVDPVGDARRRFNVRFYLVAVLFLVFDVEIIFLYPWAVLFPKLKAGVAQWDAARAAAESASASPVSSLAALAGQLNDAGYTPAFIAAGVGVFFLLLTVGFVYEWRKGVFRWD